MILRAYTPGDCAAMARLFYDTVHAVNARDYTPEQLGAWASGAVDLEAWNRSFSGHDTLLAEADGVLIGFADMDENGYLDRLYVHKDFQRRGIASALVNALEVRAKNAGVLRFETHASVTARPFFEKRGYRIEAENTAARKGVALMNYKMVKQL